MAKSKTKKKTVAKKKAKAKPTKPAVSQKWRKLLKLNPGYDPFRDAGDCWFDAKAAQLAMDFFPECLNHVEGEKAGQPFVLEKWQQSIVANLFGWKRPDGTRRYRKCAILVPRKNGKTTMVAGIALYVMFCDNEPGAEIYSAAADAKQAALVFKQAAGMVFQEPYLSSKAKVLARSITIENTGTYYWAISATSATKHGYNSHLVIIDELHAQPNRNLVDALVTSTASRRQPLIIYISTSDYDRESICNETYDYAAQVRDGIIKDPYMLPVLYTLGKDEDWKDPKSWARVNPNLGICLKRDYLDEEFKAALETPAYENTFRRLHLNQKTEQLSRYIPMDAWRDCGGAFDIDSLYKRLCFGGLDLSSTQDLASFVMAFPFDAGVVKLLARFWIPEERAREREEKNRINYSQWARQGLITLTPGNVIDYDFIRAQVRNDAEMFDLQAIGYDPWNATQTALKMQDEDGLKMVPMRQGFLTMNEPTKELLRLIISGNLHHGDNEILTWNANNLSVKTDVSANVRPVKPDFKIANKIDGIIAAIMAVGMAALTPAESRESIYNTESLTVL